MKESIHMLCFPSTFLWNICALQLDSRPVINEEDGKDTDDEEEDDSDETSDGPMFFW